MALIAASVQQVKLLSSRNFTCLTRCMSVKATPNPGDKMTIAGKEHPIDHMNNITPHLLSHVGRNLHLQKHHPLNHISQRIINFIYSRYLSPRGNPLFSVHNQIHPVVTVQQNFDSLLIPKDHVSRKKSDNFYVNEDKLLRAHTSAHQNELISMGLDNFLVIADVYRRDEIDSSHYPVFHQVEGVRLFTKSELYGNHQDMEGYDLFLRSEPGQSQPNQQHTDTIRRLEADLKSCLMDLATTLFGKDVEMRWVDAYFPFTHPSWELEVLLNGEWMEMLGCGLVQQQILSNCGVGDKVGWAFGLGLERWAMKLYEIPDIRVFWSKDPGFLTQFAFDDPATPVKFKLVSKCLPCSNDISFWLPTELEFEPTDFYDLVRDVGGSLVERVHLIDKFTHPKTGRSSHCYRIVYRHMDRTLTQEEVNLVHHNIETKATDTLGITVR